MNPNDPEKPADAAPQEDPGTPAGAAIPQEREADNIRDAQQTHGAGAVPAAFVGSGDDPDSKPEDAADNSGRWDELGRETPDPVRP